MGIEVRTYRREEGPAIMASRGGGAVCLAVGGECYYLDTEDACALGRVLCGEEVPEPEPMPEKAEPEAPERPHRSAPRIGPAVLAALEGREMTAPEIAAETGIKNAAVWNAITRLAKKGEIIPCGTAASGARVYRLAGQGPEPGPGPESRDGSEPEPEEEPADEIEEEDPDARLCAEARRMLRKGPVHRDDLMRELGVAMPELRRIMCAVGAKRTSSPVFWALEA